MEGMSSDDRFGLQGDPEVREARRVRFGSEHIETLFLVMASLSALISTGLALMGGWDWSSFLLTLTLPVALWGWGLSFKARRTATPFKHLGLMVYLTMIGLRYAAELVADTTPKNRLRIQSIFPNRVSGRKYGSGRRGDHPGAVPGWAK